jgi:hypothetical protein
VCDAVYTFARRVVAGALCVCRVPARHVLEGGCCEPEAMVCVGLRRGTLSVLSFGGHDGSGVWSSIEELAGLWQQAAMAAMRETRVSDLACDGLDGCDAHIWPD